MRYTIRKKMKTTFRNSKMEHFDYATPDGTLSNTESSITFSYSAIGEMSVSYRAEPNGIRRMLKLCWHVLCIVYTFLVFEFIDFNTSITRDFFNKSKNSPRWVANGDRVSLGNVPKSTKIRSPSKITCTTKHRKWKRWMRWMCARCANGAETKSNGKSSIRSISRYHKRKHVWSK